MHISDAVASLNYDRYQSFITNESGDADNAVSVSVSADMLSSDSSSFKLTSLVFDGPAYRGFSASTFTAPQYEYAQKHIRILSGLYGILKPWDLIQEYRLEVSYCVGITSTLVDSYSNSRRNSCSSKKGKNNYIRNVTDWD